MDRLPDGTVTFFLTDVVGSVPLWERDSSIADQVIARHDELIASIVAANGGQMLRLRGEGDSSLSVFTDASAAVTAAASVQAALATEPWPAAFELRVRMGMHTGPAAPVGGKYYGSTVNRCARIRDLAPGGLVLLSEATAALARGALPSGVRLRDLGVHRLRGFDRSERLFQLIGRDTQAPPDNQVFLASHQHVLPTGATSVIGRQAEVSMVRGLILDGKTRLVTLTGPGGVGKTRLAIEAATALLDEIDDGIWFVPLASIDDAALVAPAIARVLGIRDGGGRPVAERVAEYLQDKRGLLILDNFEQVIGATQMVAELLGQCRRLVVLVTSRAVLHLSSERDVAVVPLIIPDRSSTATAGALAACPSVQLFTERAQAIRADFALTDDNAPTVGEICRRLDGLPLAIELAASRSRHLSPTAMLERLDRRLPLLTGGPRDLPARQQTLRMALDWSYGLLGERDRVLFRRLAVFPVGCTLTAAEIVAGGDLSSPEAAGSARIDVLDGLASLVDNSLVQRVSLTGPPRFVMLETVREYALDHLEASGEASVIRDRHAAWCLGVAERAEHELRGARQTDWLDQLELEHENFRAAVRHAIDTSADELGLRIAGGLWRFWQVRGHLREARGWLTRLLALPGASQPTLGRAKALNAAGFVAFLLGDHERAESFHLESLAIRRELADDLGVIESLHNLGLAVRCLGRYADAERSFEEGLALSRTHRVQFWEARLLQGLARARFYTGEHNSSRELLEENLRIGQIVGDIVGRAIALGDLSDVARATGNTGLARSLLAESLALWRQLGDERGVAQCAESLALLLPAHEQPELVTRLLGMASALREQIGEPPSPSRQQHLVMTLTATRRILGDAAYEGAWIQRGSDGGAALIEHIMAVTNA